MRDKAIAIVGAGPGLGYALAGYFGKKGYRVGLISRAQESLDEYVRKLADQGVVAAGFRGDIMEPHTLEHALYSIEARFDGIDILEFSPMPDGGTPHILDGTRESFEYQMRSSILPAVTAARAVLPGMIDRGDGALLFTTGASSIIPMPSHGVGGTAQAALRSYAFTMNEALRDQGIYVGTIAVANIIARSALAIASGSSGGLDPSEIAATYWDMCLKRDRVEEVMGDPDLLIHIERSHGGKVASTVLDHALAERANIPA